MEKIIRLIKKMFGIYEIGYQYLVNTKDIKVNPEWRETKVGKAKFIRKMKHWYRTGEFESRIVLDREFHLLDGYSSLRIAEIKGIDKVPVYFVD